MWREEWVHMPREHQALHIKAYEEERAHQCLQALSDAVAEQQPDGEADSSTGQTATGGAAVTGEKFHSIEQFKSENYGKICPEHEI